MSDTVQAPVKFEVDTEGQVSLTFGPMPMDDLIDTLVNLATEEGSDSFLRHLNEALLKEVSRER